VFQGIPQRIRLHVGGTQQLAVNVQDLSGNATDIPITYSTSDQTIASVTTSGLVTALKIGDATITAHAKAARVDIPIHVASEPLTTLVASPSVGGCPYGVAVASSGVGYVTSICGSSVLRFDEPARTLGPSVTVNSAPAHVALNPAGNVAYVANQTSQSISVIDVATNTVTATIPLTGADVYNLKVSPGGTRLYVTRQDGKLFIIDTGTRNILTTVTVGVGPNGLAFDPTKSILYVSAIQSGTITVVNTATYAVTNTYTVGGMPQRIAVAPDGSELYVANEVAGLNIVNLRTGDISSISLGGTAIGLALTAAGEYVYVALANRGAVKVVDVGTREVYKTITTGGDPRNIAIAADGTVIVADQTGYLRFIH
jgi:YVTN family beta-propeller protein